jgi:hypothetical protein
MQAESHIAGGVRRLYRPAPAASIHDRSGFTGTREGETEVWAWVYQAGLGDAARTGAQAFTDGYNETMQRYLADPASRRPCTSAATRPAD